MSDLKNQLVRLGTQRPDLRSHLRPILREIDASPRFASDATPRELLDHLDNYLPYPHSWDSVDRGFNEVKPKVVVDAVRDMLGSISPEDANRLEGFRPSSWLAFAKNRLGLEGKDFYVKLAKHMSKRDFAKGLQAFIEDSHSIPGLDESSVPSEYQEHANAIEQTVSRSRLEVLEGPHFNVFYDALTLKYKDMEISLSQSEMMNLKAIKSLSRYIQDTYEIAQGLLERNRQSQDVWYDQIYQATNRITGRGKGKSLIYSAIAQYLKDRGIRVHS